MSITGPPIWTWPDWRKAPSGLRVRHNQSGRHATYIKPAKNPHNGAIVRWDGQETTAYVVAPARDLTPVRMTAWAMVGFDSNLQAFEHPQSIMIDGGADQPAMVRIKGGRTHYEAVTYYDNTAGEKVKLSRLVTGPDGIRQINRWVDPDTELEIIVS